VLVENHKIDGQPLQPPVFVGTQELADEFEFFVVLDPDQHNGPVA
jgi:hypothetical protein